MSHLPVIVAAGGINPAGRTAFHYAYRRMVIDALPADTAQQTLLNLAVLMGRLQNKDGQWMDASGSPIDPVSYITDNRSHILDATLIRKLEHNLFEPHRLPHHIKTQLSAATEEGLEFSVPNRKLPEHMPDNWQVTPIEGSKSSRVRVMGSLDVMLPDFHQSEVNCAGQLPSGFDPGLLYPSRNHPRGLQMTVFGASDALFSMGIDWEEIRRRVPPDQISVYAGSSLNQLDYNGYGGLLQARLLGKKVTSKQLPLGFGEMPADFINAYILGHMGTTGTNLGACASFHYNLCQGIRDIQHGTHRVVIVGGSEAPIVPEIIEAFVNMGALADDEKLKKLDAVNAPDHRRSCRPFAENVGFTLGESAQFVILFDDALAVELGANILGAVNDVFISSDGHKKSIASPGVGNYVTMAKATAATRAVLGEQALRERTFVQAHGTGTPQNRVTESAIFTDIARYFGIQNWPVSAIKSYLGHSICCAGADQLSTTLGVWKYGILPGILTSETLADDVSTAGLDFLLAHRDVGTEAMDAAILNAKGFGGNNATASLLSPHVTRAMLDRKHGSSAMLDYKKRNEKVQQNSQDYEDLSNLRAPEPVYKFDHHVKTGENLHYDADGIRLDNDSPGINLNPDNPYQDMCD